MLGIAIAAALGVAAGVAAGWVAWQGHLHELPARLLAWLQRALVPLVSIAVLAAVLAAGVALAKTDGEHDELWAQLIAAAFLLGITLLLYASGARQYTANRRIVVPQGSPKAVASGAPLTAADYGRLPAADREKVHAVWKATKDFTIDAPTLTIPKDRSLPAAAYDQLPASARDKFTTEYVTRARVTWAQPTGRAPSDEPAGTSISKDDFDKLAPPEQTKIDVRHRATENVKFSLPGTSRPYKKDEPIEAGDLALHRALVEPNAVVSYTATAALEVPGEGSTVIEEGQAVSRALRAEMTAEQRKGLTPQHGLYFRALYVGADGRWSTSKLQVLLWTFAVMFALTALFVANELLGLQFDVDPSSTVTNGDFGDIELQEQYLLLLGGPFAAAVIAKASTQSKVAQGDLMKSADPEPSGLVDGLREVISTDAGRTDILDFQYFLFNMLALVIFVVSFVPHLTDGMPVLPWFLVGLTSTSALAYATKKTLERSQPQITAVVPERVRPGQQLEIQGRNLIAPPARPPTVSIGDTPIRASDIHVTGSAQDDLQRVQLSVPAATKPAPDVRLLVVPEGSGVSAETTVAVLGPVIDEVQPSTVPLRSGAKVLVFGDGFGEQAPATGDLSATIGTLPLHVDDWSDTKLGLALGDVPDGTAGGSARLRIAIVGVGVADTTVSLSLPATTIDHVVPPTITLTGDPVVNVVGSGFGPVEGELWLGEWKLTPVLLWRDELVQAQLQLSAIPTKYDQDQTATVLVVPKDRPRAVKDVTVHK